MTLQYLVAKWKHFSYRIKSRKQKFTEIYEKCGFSGEEFPMSGIGSSLDQTEQLRRRLPLLFSEYGITSLVDAPCGDFTWMEHVNLEGVEYHGFDIVRSVVEKNRLRYGRDNIQFDELDIVKQVPLRADLILCRDCLVHLSNGDALKALANFKKSGSRYLLTTTFTDREENTDLVSGRGWRTINLNKPPFNLPRPLTLIVEGCTEADGQFGDKSLGLWLLKDLH
jgi:hypothetical protein